MWKLKLIAEGITVLSAQQKLLEQAFRRALKPRQVVVALEELQGLGQKHHYPLHKIQKFFEQDKVHPGRYLWKTNMIRAEQLTAVCPDLPKELLAILDGYRSKQRSPKRSLPFPHLVWHKQTSWLKDNRRFPVIGITCLVRPPVIFHTERAERVYSLRVDRMTLGIIFHPGSAPDDSAIRCIAGQKLVHTKIFEAFFDTVDSLRPKLVELFFQQKYAELSGVLFQSFNEAIDRLGDTGFKMADY
jgi:hypothetical protein